MYDIVIRGGTIIDGTGEAAFTGDVAIANGRFAAVFRLDRGDDGDGIRRVVGDPPPHSRCHDSRGSIAGTATSQALNAKELFTSAYRGRGRGGLRSARS